MLDSHFHLNDDTLYPIRQEVMERAFQCGVNLFLVVGWDVASSEKAVEIAHEFPHTYAAVGIHPENLEGVNEDSLKEIETLAHDPNVIAIGEVGLDYHWFHDPKEHENQKTWFKKQIDLANKLNLPLTIHGRDASEDLLKILSETTPKFGAVLHCYSGSPEMLERFAQLGLYFGFDGPITYKNAITPKESVIRCPLDRLLTETDSPYLSPTPYRGKTNEPAHIVEIQKQIAFLKGMPEDVVEKQVLNNFEKLFHVKQ